jgi:hypothetical protein
MRAAKVSIASKGRHRDSNGIVAGVAWSALVRISIRPWRSIDLITLESGTFEQLQRDKPHCDTNSIKERQPTRLRCDQQNVTNQFFLGPPQNCRLH